MIKKRIFCLFLTLLVLVSVLSCSPASPDKPQDSELDIKEDIIGKDGKITVILDAGHGFGDVGCTSEYLSGLYEKEITLKYINELKTKLEEKGFEVLLTHDGESYMHESELVRKAQEYGVEYLPEHIEENGVFDAYERAVYTNILLHEREIDYFLSLHVNAHATSKDCEGFEIDYCAENDYSVRSKFVFDSVCRSLKAAFPDTPRKEFADSWDNSFIVTKHTRLPSALLEIGFATTQSDAEKILDEKWQAELTDAVAAGIADSFK